MLPRRNGQSTNSRIRKKRLGLPLVRRALLVRAKPDRIPNRCSALRHVKKARTLYTRLLIGCVFEHALPHHHVVSVFHIVALIATAYRTGEPVIGLSK